MLSTESCCYDGGVVEVVVSEGVYIIMSRGVTSCHVV